MNPATRGNGEHAPASSWIGVDRLFVPGLVVEIEAVAVLDAPARR